MNIEKLSLASVKNVLSRAELKKIMAGSGGGSGGGGGTGGDGGDCTNACGGTLGPCSTGPCTSVACPDDPNFTHTVCNG